jgi:hypothetical protein
MVHRKNQSMEMVGSNLVENYLEIYLLGAEEYFLDQNKFFLKDYSEKKMLLFSRPKQMTCPHYYRLAIILRLEIVGRAWS